MRAQSNARVSTSTTSDFGAAFRLVRKACGLTQEDFDEVSSRVYVSALERGVKQPTLPKVDALAQRLGVHPLSVLALAYCHGQSHDELHRLLSLVEAEAASVLKDAGTFA